MTRVTPAPGSLEAVQAISDPEQMLRELTRYIDRGEERLVAARKFRARTVADLRRAQVPWPRLVGWTGVSETYLRREIKTLTGRAAQTAVRE